MSSECSEAEKWGRSRGHRLGFSFFFFSFFRLFVLFLEAWNINIFCTFEIACGACLAMAARASNILVCWERRITRDSLQTQAGTAAQSCSSSESFYCLNLGNFKQVKLIFRMKCLSCRPARLSGWNICQRRLSGEKRCEVQVEKRRSLQSFISWKLHPAGRNWRHSSARCLTH